jgi:hypothetical protein
MYSRILLPTLVHSLLLKFLLTAILGHSGMSSIIRRLIITSSNPCINHQLPFRCLLKIIILIMLLKSITNLSRSSSSSHHSMALSSRFSILRLIIHMLNTFLHLNHSIIQVAHHSRNNGTVRRTKRNHHSTVAAVVVAVATPQVVVVLKLLLWARLFVWVLVMIDRWNQCLKRAMVILRLTQMRSTVLQFHSLSLLIKAILHKTFLLEVGRLSTQILSTLRAHIEVEEAFNIGASAIL